MAHHHLLVGIALCLVTGQLSADERPNLNTLPPDLVVPKVERTEPAVGRRVAATTAGWNESDVHHTLSLPLNWKPDAKHPVLVEFPGNGGYRNEWGDVSDGTVEGCVLGYGLSGDDGFLWLCLPFVEKTADGTWRNATTWWGDVEETKRYCRATVRDVCERFHGDPAQVILCGFSRGAIACNYIGLNDDEIASLWRAFFCHSHYDGVRRWPYADSDGASAIKRLQRLRGRPQWISHEQSVDEIRQFLEQSGVQAPFQFTPLPYVNHSAAWVLRDLPERRQAREWLRQVLESTPTAKP